MHNNYQTCALSINPSQILCTNTIMLPHVYEPGKRNVVTLYVPYHTGLLIAVTC